jgi:LysR family hydrogen peroxide-inducible transcriptional activator
MRMATLTQLEYLIAVDKHRHFGKAAKACHVSQPTLSMQLQKLEEEYEVTFFDRSKQPILVNPEAIPLIEQAKTILREFEKLKHLINDQSSEPSGEFRLGVIPTVAPYLLPRFIGDFANAYPKVNLSIREMTTNQITDALDQDELDAGILATPLQILSFDERPLYYEPFFVFTAPNHPIAKLKSVSEDDLTANGIWLLSEGHCLRNQIVKLCSARKTSAVFKNVSFESGSLETIIELVQGGHGYTLLPALATARLAAENAPGLKALKSPVPTREISLVYRRSQYKQNILKALTESIRSHLPKDVFSKRNPQMSIIQLK